MSSEPCSFHLGVSYHLFTSNFHTFVFISFSSHLEVQSNGKIGSKKRVTLSGKKLDLPEKDISDLKFGVEQGVDVVFASFIQNKKAVEEVRKAMGKAGDHIPIISKVMA